MMRPLLRMFHMSLKGKSKSTEELRVGDVQKA